jgi:dTDP-4-amino-4,6-dideoxygalactose transaminase
VETGVHYPTLDCDQPGWKDMHKKMSPLNTARRSVAQILTVPCYPHLSDAECASVCAALAALP